MINAETLGGEPADALHHAGADQGSSQDEQAKDHQRSVTAETGKGFLERQHAGDDDKYQHTDCHNIGRDVFNREQDQRHSDSHQ